MIPKRFQSSNRGAALIVVLAVVVLLSLTVVALTLAMRTERQASHYYVERARADLLVRDAIEQVRAKLQYSVNDTGRKWITNPGLILSTTSTFANTTNEVVELFSGVGDATLPSTDILAPADLNREVYSQDSQPAIVSEASGAPLMNVGWVYVRKDGSRETNQTPDLNDAANPIIGRYAYWADDESARINLNTAWKRQITNAVSTSHPSQVSLKAIPDLTDDSVDEIRAVANTFPFASSDDARRASPEIAAVLSDNRFFITHHSPSSDRNPWGDPKIVLTTQKKYLPSDIASLSDSRDYFLDILKQDNTDPGSTVNISGSKLTYQLNRLKSILSRSDWPYSSGSFQGKYGGTNSTQMALDLIEYVRAAESANTVVEGIRLLPQGSGFLYDSTSVTSAEALTGTTRRPMLTEVAVRVGDLESSGTSKFRQFTYRVELLIPKNYSIPQNVLDGKLLTVTCVVPNSGAPNRYISVGRSLRFGTQVTEYVERGGNIFAVIMGTYSHTYGASEITDRPPIVYFRVVFNAGGTGGDFSVPFWELAPSALVAASAGTYMNYYIPYTVDDMTVPLNQITSVQVSDPRINKFKDNWEQGANTFGNYNFNWLAPMVANPPQDTQDGNVSDASLYMPSPKGTTNNPNGVVSSVAELGYLPTGVGANVPWRSLRLQPTPASALPPDWALLDVFTPPLFPRDNPKLYFPFGNSLAGRVNINNKIYPYTNMDRTVPLQSLFKGIPSLTDGEIENLTENISKRTLATQGKEYGRTDAYDSVGELAEIAGVADKGEASEDLLRKFVDLTTVSSRAFRIYAVGQSLQQTPRGTIVLQAEKAVSAVVEADGTNVRIINWKLIPL